MPDRVRITEVGPRDGLQNEPGVIPTAEKVRLVELCAATGVDEVEVTSFVSPKWVPQLGDAAEVFAFLRLPLPEGGGRGVGSRDTQSPANATHDPAARTLSSHVRATTNPTDPQRFRPPAKSWLTIEKAKALRKGMTGPEKALWYILSDRRSMGVKFRRQHPFGPYILDFFCQEKLLAVEVDGRTHADELAQQHDERRDRYIEFYGIKVVRVSNDAVLKAPQDVAAELLAAIRSRPSSGAIRPVYPRDSQTSGYAAMPDPLRTSPPTPQPPPSGRGLQSPALSVLVPNEKGLDAAMGVNAASEIDVISKCSVFTAASETFSKKNTNASIAETIQRFEPVVAKSHHADLLVRGYISCVIACPFEGPIAPAAVVDVAKRLIDIGVDEIDLGDTIGAGTPETVRVLLESVHSELGDEWWTEETMTLHLHDTFNRAADCVKAALDLGVRSFDGSVAGLGGCPYASTPGKRAPGNISTETLVRTIHAAGYETGVDLDRLAIAADFAREIVARARATA